jgi:hypothetical protein
MKPKDRRRPPILCLWRYPCLHHVTFDDVPLNSLTVRASKRPQILAPHAWLNRRQPHGRATCGALRTLVLFIEHVYCSRKAAPQFGVLSSPASQPIEFDLRGSDAMTLISTWSHLGHSNSRCSKPIGPVETRSSIIRVWQREQRARSISVKNWSGKVTAFLHVRRERYRTLCHRW